MARIRSLKPGFFKNEDLCALPFECRLCFEGLWCYADREGRLEDRPKRLKAEIFPYDDLDMDALLTTLHEAGFIVRFRAESRDYIEIPTFTIHQRPKQDEAGSLIPSARSGIPRKNSRYGDGPDTVPRLDIGHRTGDIGQGTGEGSDAPPPLTSSSAETDPQAPECKVEAFVQLWNDIVKPPIAQCRGISDARRRHIRARLKEHGLGVWRDAFERVAGSKFCRGEVPPGPGRSKPFVASLDWLIEGGTVILKVLEGKYDDRPDLLRPTGTDGRGRTGAPPRGKYDGIEE